MVGFGGRVQALLAFGQNPLVWSCVESCRTVGIHGKRATHKLEVKIEEKQCLHYYHYYVDERFGLLHTRLQTW